MKITANLLQSPPRRPLLAAAGLWLAGLSLAGLAAWMHAGTQQREEDVQVLRDRVARLGEQLAAVPVAELPPKNELDALRSRLAAINASTARGMGAAPLLAWLEAELPADVRLVSLDLKARDGEVLIVAESASEPSLTDLLRRLESEPRFRNVLLSRQASRGTASSGGLRVEVRFRQGSS